MQIIAPFWPNVASITLSTGQEGSIWRRWKSWLKRTEGAAYSYSQSSVAYHWCKTSRVAFCGKTKIPLSPQGESGLSGLPGREGAEVSWRVLNQVKIKSELVLW